MINKALTFQDVIAGERSLEPVIERFGFGPLSWKKKIEEACINSGEDPDFVVEMLNAFSPGNDFDAEKLKRFSIQTIIDYLKKTHYFYLYKKIPEIELSFHNLISKSSYTHPELIMLSSLFINYKQELAEHIEQEELLLFPYILELEKASRLRSSNSVVLKNYSLQKFHHEHDHDEHVLSEIRNTILQNMPVRDLPISFRIFLIQIENFEADLFRHAMIEDQVLLPAAAELEHKVK